MPYDILIVSVLSGLIEVAGLMLFVRGLLWLFGPKARKGNFVYDILTIGTAPFLRVARRLSPRFVSDAHISWIAFFLLFWIYVGLGYAKLSLCAWHGVECKQLVQ